MLLKSPEYALPTRTGKYRMKVSTIGAFSDTLLIWQLHDRLPLACFSEQLYICAQDSYSTVRVLAAQVVCYGHLLFVTLGEGNLKR